VGLNSQNKHQKELASLSLFKKWLPRLTDEQLLELKENLDQSYHKEQQRQEQSATIQQQEIIIDKLKQDIKNQELKTQKSLVYIEQLLDSTSWQITQPLRMLAQYFKR
ncbi:MAG: hypothetical protein KAJ63_13360, partial [Methyloprofundus sp.]|nr:hypothetical protein [Methyloprofundus sp.]